MEEAQFLRAQAAIIKEFSERSELVFISKYAAILRSIHESNKSLQTQEGLRRAFLFYCRSEVDLVVRKV